ncbi:MAG: DNA mismatch repair protein MutS [Acidobacteriota bacterium]|nr:DNA mismatch repair protein MutS [Acidobacteriota bacterium]
MGDFQSHRESETPHAAVEHAAVEYTRRRERFRRLEEAATQRSLRLSWARLAVFLAGVACLAVTLFYGGGLQTAGYLGAAVALIVFMILVRVHGRVIRRQRRWASLVRVNEHALLRLKRDWAALPEPPRLVPPTSSAAATVRDLDLFGPASVAQLLGAVGTPPGRETLGRWLTRGAASEVLAQRQRAVAELAPRLGFRQRLEALAAELVELAPEPEKFVAWAEDRPWLGARPALRLASFALPVISLGLLVAGIATPLPLHFWLISLVLNLGFSFAVHGPIHDAFARVSVRGGELAFYGRIFEHLLRLPGTGASRESALAPYREALVGRGTAVDREMDRLDRLVQLSDLRLSMMHPVVEALCLWDFHVLHRMERWQRRVGPQVRKWFQVLGEVEVLAAFAGLLHDEPGWCFPVVDAAGPLELRGRELGHPLLAAEDRVCNTVTVGPPGSFLLVTGSNMSGKSTLLRALGVNAVLAQAGAPVCASEWVMPPLRLGTSIRVEDSLARGTSFFMAELERLKEVVDAAEGSTPLLYLLDEILRGTNSAERQIAVRKVLEHLLAAGAIGAVSTHDLELAAAEELRDAAVPVHFRETLHPPGVEPAMTFDYQLRPGIATTTNALRLLELVGLTARPPAPSGR